MYNFKILEIIGNQAKVEFENSSGLFYTRFVNVPKNSVFDSADPESLKKDKMFSDIIQGIQQGLQHKENLGITEFTAKEAAPTPPPEIIIQNEHSEES